MEHTGSDRDLGVTPRSRSLEGRRTRFASAVAQAGLDAALVSPGPDLAYLLGESHSSWERLTVLGVATGRPSVLFVPALERGAWTTLEDDVEIVTWRDGEDPHALAAAFAGTGRVAVSEILTAGHLVRMGAIAKELSFELNDALGSMRSIKDPWEIDQLRAAGSALDEVFVQIPGLLRPGRTELEVSDAIGRLMLDHGFTNPDFVAVAAGESGANPHHAATPRVLRTGDVVFIDASGPWGPGGYYADSTRTFALGAPAREAVRVNESLCRAYAAAFAAAVPGATAESVDAAARESLREDGYAEAFLHRLGHGIGLDVHEAPNLVAGNTQLLEPGMAFSVEPGVYLDGAFGSRIEDIVVLGADGPEALNRGTRELIVV
ncbi:MAG TPA: Xaa-Pro peptidase family protein [Marmoricola sp.]|jgi:Xaa-Pro aminopeptidase|nr:Xaa-Pro peptidase family protein [Marmoricola sp.]